MADVLKRERDGGMASWKSSVWNDVAKDLEGTEDPGTAPKNGLNKRSRHRAGWQRPPVPLGPVLGRESQDAHARLPPASS